MKNNFIIIAIVLVSTLLLGGVVWAMSGSNQAQVINSANAKAETENVFHNWGEIGIRDGDVVAEFPIKNSGTDVLQLYNLTTSCSCTNAQFVSQDGDESPLFGMHSKSKYIYEVQPGEIVTLKAIYDPMFHGPSGVGSITRQVTVQTNDSKNPQLTFNMSAEVK